MGMRSQLTASFFGHYIHETYSSHKDGALQNEHWKFHKLLAVLNIVKIARW